MIDTIDIVEKLKRKDEKAFELVFRVYYPELCRFALKYVANTDEAEELVQDIFYQIWNKLDRLAINTSLKSYLYSSVRNAAFNQLKHQKVVEKHVDFAMQSESDESEFNSLEIKELDLKIKQAILSLPERCRAVFELSRFENKKYSEIAEDLEISIKTVEAQMGKALKILRVELGSYLPITLLIALELINL